MFRGFKRRKTCKKKLFLYSGHSFDAIYTDQTTKSIQNLDIFSQGESFVDPDTGEELGSEEELVAKVEIFSAQSKFSKASIIDGFGSGNITKGMVARVVKPTKKQSKKKKKLW